MLTCAGGDGGGWRELSLELSRNLPRILTESIHHFKHFWPQRLRKRKAGSISPRQLNVLVFWLRNETLSLLYTTPYAKLN